MIETRITLNIFQQIFVIMAIRNHSAEVFGLITCLVSAVCNSVVGYSWKVYLPKIDCNLGGLLLMAGSAAVCTISYKGGVEDHYHLFFVSFF